MLNRQPGSNTRGPRDFHFGSVLYMFHPSRIIIHVGTAWQSHATMVRRTARNVFDFCSWTARRRIAPACSAHHATELSSNYLSLSQATALFSASILLGNAARLRPCTPRPSTIAIISGMYADHSAERLHHHCVPRIFKLVESQACVLGLYMPGHKV